MRRKCVDCLVFYDEMFDEDHSKFHTSMTEIILLYLTHRSNQFKWRTDPSQLDHMNRWKGELLALSSDVNIGLSIDVFLEVLFKPREYYKHGKLNKSFVSTHFTTTWYNILVLFTFFFSFFFGRSNFVPWV